jgi:hypothetical protein
MKNSKNQLLVARQQIGTVGLPNNNQAIYVPTAAFPNTTTLYGWRNGQPIQGAIALTKNGTIGQAVDHSGATSECEFIAQGNGTNGGYYSSSDAAFAFTGSFSIGVWAYRADWAKIPNVNYSSGVIARYASTGWGIFQYSGATKWTFQQNAISDIIVDLGHLSSGWHFISVSRDTANSTTKFSVDVVRLASANTVSTITAAGVLNIGSYGGAGVYNLGDTRLSDVWIHNGTAWTDAQVQAIYTATAPAHQHNQALAGHRMEVVQPNTTAAETLALYKFGSDLTVDEKGTYPLTVVGAPTQAEDIFGNMGALRTSSGNVLTNSNLLATAPSRGIWISCWIKAESTGATQIPLSRTFTSPTHEIALYQTNSGLWTMNYGAGVNKYIYGSTPVKIGKFEKIDICWDTLNGTRLFINSVLEAQDSTATTLPTFNSTYPFQIGRYYNGAASSPFSGSICDLKVMDKIPTQYDIDVAYSSTFPKPDIAPRGLDLIVRRLADKNKETREKASLVAVDSSLVYRGGFRQLYGSYLPTPNTDQDILFEGGDNNNENLTGYITPIPFKLLNINNAQWYGSAFTPIVGGNFLITGAIRTNPSVGGNRYFGVINGSVGKLIGYQVGTVNYTPISGSVYIPSGMSFNIVSEVNATLASGSANLHWLKITRLNEKQSAPLVNNGDTIQIRGQ